MSQDDRTRRSVLEALALGAAGAALLPGHRAFAQPTLKGSTTSDVKAYVNFAINVQNFKYLDTSADVVVALCAMFKKHGVQGDFYITGPMCKLYNKSRPDAIEALKGQGLAYHVRPPHPLFNPFDSRFEEASAEELPQRIERAESKRLDLETGEFNDKEDGGFKLVKDTFGRAPVTVGAPNDNATIKQKALEYYKSQGAKAVVWWHGEKDLGSNPYSFQYDMLARPSDIVVDQWEVDGASKELWWNRLKDGDCADGGKPHNRIAERVAAFTGRRPPHVVALIHDDNFTRRGPDPWINSYWTDRQKSGPESAPFDLNAADPSVARGDAEQTRIKQMYNTMIEYCATNYKVVTMDDIVGMAT